MIVCRLTRLRRIFPILLGICFALQVLAFAPAHAFHGSHALEAQHDAGPAHKKSPAPEECRCDLCLAFRALDTGSVVAPPVLGLAETAFSVVAAYPSYSYSTPILFSFARGPPSLLA